MNFAPAVRKIYNNLRLPPAQSERCLSGSELRDKREKRRVKVSLTRRIVKSVGKADSFTFLSSLLSFLFSLAAGDNAGGYSALSRVP